jgi:type IV pilus assembly protein PilC
MATFTYKALDARGMTAAGQIDADNKSAVAASLRNKGLTVVDIDEVKTSLAKVDIFAGLQRIKAKDLTIFSRQFATMINSGLAMLRALSVLEEQTENPKLAAVLTQVRADVEAGISLSDALEKHPRVFSPLYVNMVRAGEIGGILDEVLNRLATQLEKDDQIRRAVKSAMTYPTMIAGFALIVMTGMVLFLIPVFAGMYQELGNAKLPLLTRMMVTVSDTMRSWKGAVVVVVIIALVVLIGKLKRTEKGTEVWDRFKLHVPMGIGEVIRKIAVARFSRTLGTLVSSGVPILQAIEITGKSAGNVVIEHAMQAVQVSVKEGQTISEPLKHVSVFPDMVVQMISVGEETGALDAMLQKVADFYEDEVSAAVKSLTSIIEPIMMIGVGAIVGVVVIGMYLPIFDMMNVIKQ